MLHVPEEAPQEVGGWSSRCICLAVTCAQRTCPCRGAAVAELHVSSPQLGKGAAAGRGRKLRMSLKVLGAWQMMPN